MSLSYTIAEKYFSYDPDTGNLIWKMSKSRRIKKGSIAGVINKNKCVTIMLDYKNYKAHHIVWLLVYREWPKEIDHIDGDPTNNKLSNLRIATRSQNSRNVRRHIDNMTGYKGVTKMGGKYLARIRNRRIGLFLTPEEASAAYEQVAAAEYGEFYRDQR